MFINVFRYLLYEKENSFTLPATTLIIKAIFKPQAEEEG